MTGLVALGVFAVVAGAVAGVLADRADRQATSRHQADMRAARRRLLDEIDRQR